MTCKYMQIIREYMRVAYKGFGRFGIFVVKTML